MIKISEFFNDEKNKQATVYYHGERYIVSMDKEWRNQYVAEYELLDEAEDCAEDWVNE